MCNYLSKNDKRLKTEHIFNKSYDIYLAELVHLTLDPQSSCTASSEQNASYLCRKAYPGVVKPTGRSEWTARDIAL